MARVIEVEEEKPKNERLISRGASSGCMLTAAFTVYGFVTRDIPLMFLCLSYLSFVLSPVVEKYTGSFGSALANAMKGFSMALLAGALLMTIF